MKKVAYSILLLSVLAGAFVTGAWYSHHKATTAGERKVLYWHDPMHPAYKSDKPGIAPDCGMQLEPVYADGGPASGSDGMAAAPAGTVHIAPDKQQLIGVRLGEVEKIGATESLRLFGRVAPDETRVYRLNAGIEGSMRTVSPVTTGSFVKKNQLLAEFSAPDALQMIQYYILAVSGQERVRKLKNEGSPEGEGVALANANVLSRVAQIENIGIAPIQRAEIEKSRTVPDVIRVYAPVDGFVLARNVSPGIKFERGYEFYQIADLRRVWIVADAYDADAQYIRPGQVVQITLRNRATKIAAKVTDVLPQFDAATRTLKVRIEADNPGFVLRPEMFVDVEFPVHLPAATAIPVDAIVDTGLKKTVFVDRGNGYFEPRAVETGWRFADKVQVVRGLEPGERIVVSGTFLVDSESRLKAAAAGIYGEASRDPVCGMDVDQARARAAGKTLDLQGKTWFFCSEDCKHKFEKSPETYLAAAAPAHVHEHAAPAAQEQDPAAAATPVDPICGMKVDEKKATAAGRKSDFGGKAYFFCSDQCKKEFDRDPKAHLASPHAAMR